MKQITAHGPDRVWKSTDELVGDVRSFLRDVLPDYMIPSVFVLLDALPLTPNGKVDRLALPAPELANLQADAAFVAPRTPAEEIVAGILADVLDIEQVGVESNFFEIGGNSLLATQVVAQLRQIFGVDVPLRNFLKTPTVDGLVSALVELWGGRTTVEEIALALREVEQLSADEMKDLLST